MSLFLREKRANCIGRYEYCQGQTVKKCETDVKN